MSDKILKKVKDVKSSGPRIGVTLGRMIGDDNYGHTKVYISIEGIEIKKPGLDGIQEGFKILLDEAEIQLQAGLNKAYKTKPKS